MSKSQKLTCKVTCPKLLHSDPLNLVEHVNESAIPCVEFSLEFQSNNSYCEREYISALQRNNIFIDIILIGVNDSFDEQEDKRCGGLWAPLEQSNYVSEICISRFNSLNDPIFISRLIEANYSLGIQDGGVG